MTAKVSLRERSLRDRCEVLLSEFGSVELKRAGRELPMLVPASVVFEIIEILETIVTSEKEKNNG